jgi:DNA-binding response OmpR family regulator
VAAPPQSQEQSAPRILIVDDEDYVADMIASALEIEGYTTYVSYNGRDALADARSLQVELVIIDIMLPYINGVALIGELRTLEHLRTVPIVLISAGARPQRTLDNTTFVPKPFDMDAMISLVARRLAERGAQHDRS